MCGYCLETIALDILRDDIAGKLKSKDLGSNLHRYFYLREVSDIVPALELIKHDPKHEELTQRAIFYRGLEILITEGFESVAYQRLLKQSNYRQAVGDFCGDLAKSEYEDAVQGLDTAFLKHLYEPETYFWKDRANQLKALSNILPACQKMLRHYISWWHLGVNLQSEGEYSLDSHEYARFTIISRAVYFSILVIGSCSAGKKLLQKIVVNNPYGTLDEGGDDLWLQRIAAIKLYELEGLKPFINQIAVIRPTLYLYLDMLQPFSTEQKELLLNEASRFSITRATDNNICLFKWLGGSS